MVEEKSGWYVVNVKNMLWSKSPEYGRVGSFENKGVKFPHTGVRLWMVEPGKSNCLYHRENAQEDFLVLSGHCKLLVNEEERQLEPWDYVHCPPGVSHVFIGEGDIPCTLLTIGHRPEEHKLWYPKSDLARKYGAETPESTADPRVAYAKASPREEIEAPDWPLPR